MAYRIGIVGVTGAVGQELLALMAKRNFPVAELRPLASARSAGSKVTYGGKEWTVLEAKPEAFEGLDFAIFSAGGSISLALAPEAVKRGCIVIDNSSAYRMYPDVPLVIPEINPEALDQHKGILANPNCSTMQLMVVLKPLFGSQGKGLQLVGRVDGAFRALPRLERGYGSVAYLQRYLPATTTPGFDWRETLPLTLSQAGPTISKKEKLKVLFVTNFNKLPHHWTISRWPTCLPSIARSFSNGT